MAFFSNTLQAAKAAYKHGLEAIDVEKQAIQAKAVLKTAKQALSEVRSEEPKSEVCSFSEISCFMFSKFLCSCIATDVYATTAPVKGGIKASAPSSGYVPPSTTRQRPSHVVKIMLVGAPGHGKSRLGSFLVSPDDTMDVHDTNCKTAFEFSAQTGAFTQDISSHQAVIDGTTFEFVDTPGFGENPAKDLKHSLQAVRYLLKAEEISAVVFAFR